MLISSTDVIWASWVEKEEEQSVEKQEYFMWYNLVKC